MNTTTGLLLAALIGTPAFGIIVGKWFRPNATPLELIQEIQEERVEDRRRLEALERSQRVTLDYVHQLRQHIVDEKPPPPPAFPEGMSV